MLGLDAPTKLCEPIEGFSWRKETKTRTKIKYRHLENNISIEGPRLALRVISSQQPTGNVLIH